MLVHYIATWAPTVSGCMYKIYAWFKILIYEFAHIIHDHNNYVWFNFTENAGYSRII